MDSPMKTALVNCADSGPIESLVVMLKAAGYRVTVPDAPTVAELRRLGGLVLTNEQLVRTMGYEPHLPLPQGTVEGADLYVDVKAHQTYHRLVERWPSLQGKVLWYRINGGKPEHVVRRCKNCSIKQQYAQTYNVRCPDCEDCGDEVNPQCPVLTPNQWYSDGQTKANSSWSFYACWPPFHRYADYSSPRGARYGPPVCLIHNAEGWGYQRLIPEARKLGVRVFGRGSPDGLLDHRAVPELLRTALAYVHLKSSDAPGYALYEALAAGCPVVCTRRLIWRCRMQELLVPGETCLVFDRETHDGLTDEDVTNCTHEVETALTRLAFRDYNETIGLAGRDRLRKVMWSPDRAEDVDSFREFMRRNFN